SREVNHGAGAAPETVFSSRRRAIEREVGMGAQNPRNRKKLTLGRALEGEGIGVLMAGGDDARFGSRLVAGQQPARHKAHLGDQNEERSASHRSLLLRAAAERDDVAVRILDMEILR